MKGLTLSEIGFLAPAALATTPHESRSKQYAHIPTTNVIDMMTENGYIVSHAEQSRLAKKRSQHTKHMLRFRKENAEVIEGEGVPEVVLVNSHDGSSSYRMYGGFFRFVCSNGIIVGSQKLGERVVHVRPEQVMQDLFDRQRSIMDHVDKLATRIKIFKDVEWDEREQESIARRAAEIRWGVDDKNNVRAPLRSVVDLLEPRRPEDRGNDAWKVINRIQENIVRGGIPALTATGRNIKMPAIIGVAANVKFNSELWLEAESMITAE